MKAGESPPDQGRDSARPVPEARSRSQKSPRWSAERRCAMRFIRVATHTNHVRLSAFRSLNGEGGFFGGIIEFDHAACLARRTRSCVREKGNEQGNAMGRAMRWSGRGARP